MKNNNNTNDEATKAMMATGMALGAGSLVCPPLAIGAAIAFGIATLAAAFEDGDGGDSDGSTAGWGG